MLTLMAGIGDVGGTRRLYQCRLSDILIPIKPPLCRVHLLWLSREMPSHLSACQGRQRYMYNIQHSPTEHSIMWKIMALVGDFSFLQYLCASARHVLKAATWYRQDRWQVGHCFHIICFADNLACGLCSPALWCTPTHSCALLAARLVLRAPIQIGIPAWT